MSTYTYTLLHNLNLDHFLVGYQLGDRLVRGHTGSVEATDEDAAAEMVFAKHNRDDRPDGQEAPSLSVGDVVVIVTGDEWNTLAVAPMGFEEVDYPMNVETTKSYREVIRSREKA